MDTKKKQIEFKAGSICDGLIANYVPAEYAFMYKDGFKDGANWAYNEFINKACEWLKFHISIPYEGETTKNGDTPAKEYLDWAKKRLEVAEEICNNFRKVMEE